MLAHALISVALELAPPLGSPPVELTQHRRQREGLRGAGTLNWGSHDPRSDGEHDLTRFLADKVQNGYGNWSETTVARYVNTLWGYKILEVEPERVTLGILRPILQLPLDLLEKHTAQLSTPIGFLVYTGPGHGGYIWIHMLLMCDTEILFIIEIPEVRGLPRVWLVTIL